MQEKYLFCKGVFISRLLLILLTIVSCYVNAGEILSPMGLIDKNGSIIFHDTYNLVSNEPNEEFPSLIPIKYIKYRQAQIYGKFGYVDYNGNLIIYPCYATASPFINNYAITSVVIERVEVNGDINKVLRYGIIDINGEWVIDPVYDNINYQDNYFILSKKNEFGDTVLGFVPSNNINSITNNNDISTILLNYGIDIIINNDRYGIMDKSSNEILQPIYDMITAYKNGFARISLNRKWGYINTRGKIIIKPEYDKVEEFIDGVAVVLKNDKYYLIKTNNDIIYKITTGIRPVRFGNQIIITEFSDKSKSIKRGLMNTKGEWLIKPDKYDGLSCLFNDRMLATIGKRIYLLDSKENIISELTSDISNYYAEGFRHGSCIVFFNK